MILSFHIDPKINKKTTKKPPQNPKQQQQKKPTKNQTKYQKTAKHRKLVELYFLLMEIVIISCAPHLPMFIVMITWHQHEYQHSLNANVSAVVVS